MSVDATQFRVGDDVIVELRAAISDGPYGLSVYVANGSNSVDVPLASAISARHVPPNIEPSRYYIDAANTLYYGLPHGCLRSLDPDRLGRTLPVAEVARLVRLRPASIRPVMPE